MFLFRNLYVLSKLKIFDIINVRTVMMGSNDGKIILKEMFETAVQAVMPHEIIENKVKIQEKQLFIGDESFPLNDNVYLVGFGKGVLSMAITLEKKLQEFLKKGIVSIPEGSKNKIPEHQVNSVIEYCEGGQNNQPDQSSLTTTEKIIQMVSPLTEKDTLIILISGGGSALLCKPKPIITLQEKQQFCKSLQNAGADIIELNTIRRMLSEVKGGGLARIAYPTPVISLILSDIVGDPIDLIASGPTVCSKISSKEAISVLQKYNLYDSLSARMKNIFDDEKSLDQNLHNNVSNIIIGNNAIALKAAEKQAFKKGLHPVILRNDIKGDVRLVSKAYAKIVNFVCEVLEESLTELEFKEKVQENETLYLSDSKIRELYNIVQSGRSGGIVLISGGEPTVKVTGPGKGGRNQELALLFSLDWKERILLQPNLKKYDVLFFSAGTDGQDGPTNAAGAFGYAEIYFEIMQLKQKLIEIQKFITGSSEGKIDDDTLNQYKEFCFQNINMDTENKTICYEKQFVDNLLQKVEELNPENILINNNSYSFYSRFKKGQDLLKTGVTGTNVMDVHFVYIKNRKCSCHVYFNSEETKTSNPFTKHDLAFNEKSTINKIEENVSFLT